MWLTTADGDPPLWVSYHQVFDIHAWAQYFATYVRFIAEDQAR